MAERRTKRNAQSSERSSGGRRLLALRYRHPDGLFGQSGRLSDFPELQQSHQHAARFARQQNGNWLLELVVAAPAMIDQLKCVFLA